MSNFKDFSGRRFTRTLSIKLINQLPKTLKSFIDGLKNVTNKNSVYTHQI